MQLVQACHEANIPVVAIPGPCAAIAAISCSGLDSAKFQFIGFLPKKTGELKQALQESLHYTGTTICYESPNRLESTLTVLKELAPKRFVVIARELTKKFEEIRRGIAEELLEHIQKGQIKGEIVLLISGESDVSQDWEHMDPVAHVEWMQNTYQITRKEAIFAVAKMRNVSKRDIYNSFF